jgi:crotonobetainyl-CoA:carnitine CoA-transferase CaiB-like acyl-CoA transferase
MHLMSGHVPQGIGNGHFVHVPYNCYPTADGHIIVACIGDAFFERFAEFSGIPELQDPVLKKQPARYARKAEIDALVSEKFRTRPTAEWAALLREARIPCGPVNDFAQALSDPQVRARDMIAAVEHDTIGRLQLLGIPVKLSETPGSMRLPPPRLGQHTDAVLQTDLGLTTDAVANLRQQRII